MGVPSWHFFETVLFYQLESHLLIRVIPAARILDLMAPEEYLFLTYGGVSIFDLCKYTWLSMYTIVVLPMFQLLPHNV
jgi:hypothetical protein